MRSLLAAGAAARARANRPSLLTGRPFSGPCRSGSARASDGVEIVVDPAQQRDQNFLFILVEAGQEAPLAPKCSNDDLVVRRASLRRQRDRMAAAVLRVVA